jgi:hypothetical protein
MRGLIQGTRFANPHRLPLLTAQLRIKDKNGDTALDTLSENDTEIRALIRKAQAQASVSQDDVASGARSLSFKGLPLTQVFR